MRISPQSRIAPTTLRAPAARAWWHGHTAREGLSLVLILLLLVVRAGASDTRLRVRTLDTISVDNSHVRTARSSHGERLAVAWDGYVQGRRRIILRENVVGEWLAEALPDRNSPGENRNPVLSFDTLGNLYLAWISHRPKGDVVCLAQRIGDQWLDPIELSSQVDDEGLMCDSLSLAVIQNFPPDVWLSWQEFRNASSTVLTARLNPGNFSTPQIWTVAAAPPGSSYNLSPQLVLLHNEPYVIWFTIKLSSFHTVAARFDSTTNTWHFDAYHPLLNVIPAERFPLLFSPDPEDDLLAATWFEPSSNGDELVIKATRDGEKDSTPTQVMSIELPLRAIAQSDPVVIPISPSPDLIVSFQDRDSSTSRITVARCGLDYTQAPPSASQISITEEPQVGNPSLSIAPLGEERIALFYTSPRDQGGDGHVYFVELPMPR